MISYGSLLCCSQQKHVQYIIIYMYVIVNNFTISSHHPAGTAWLITGMFTTLYLRKSQQKTPQPACMVSHAVHQYLAWLCIFMIHYCICMHYLVYTSPPWFTCDYTVEYTFALKLKVYPATTVHSVLLLNYSSWRWAVLICGFPIQSVISLQTPNLSSQQDKASCWKASY